jgi:hypothetical protein
MSHKIGLKVLKVFTLQKTCYLERRKRVDAKFTFGQDRTIFIVNHSERTCFQVLHQSAFKAILAQYRRNGCWFLKSLKNAPWPSMKTGIITDTKIALIFWDPFWNFLGFNLETSSHSVLVKPTLLHICTTVGSALPKYSSLQLFSALVLDKTFSSTSYFIVSI